MNPRFKTRDGVLLVNFLATTVVLAILVVGGLLEVQRIQRMRHS